MADKKLKVKVGYSLVILLLKKINQIKPLQLLKFHSK